MARIVVVDEKVGLVVLAAVALLLWAVVAPESFDSTVSSLEAIIDGAISGAMEAA